MNKRVFNVFLNAYIYFRASIMQASFELLIIFVKSWSCAKCESIAPWSRVGVPDWSKLQMCLRINRIKRTKFMCATRSGWWTNHTSSHREAPRVTQAFGSWVLGWETDTAGYRIEQAIRSHQRTDGRRQECFNPNISAIVRLLIFQSTTHRKTTLM